MKPIHKLGDDEAAAISSVEVLRERTRKSGEEQIEEQIAKVRLWDKPRVLEMIARHLRLLGDGALPPAQLTINLAQVVTQLPQAQVRELGRQFFAVLPSGNGDDRG